MKEITRKLGGLPKTNRQKPARNRIKTSGMTRLLSVKKPLDLLEGSVRGITRDLVQQKNPMDGATI
jgi:hypothetical protein